ncbi:hypothetical protein D1007_09156 [Hordeum vulgare]|nr:hypothetical protein D1007_09156 [Hordeum vulgare]
MGQHGTGPLILMRDIPVKLKGNHDKKKEVKESNEPRSSMKRFAGNQGTIEDHGNFIRVDTKELSSALTTHGVSYAERTTIFDNLVNRCNDILQETIAHERGRCQVLIKKISDLIDKYIPLCDVLGEPEKVSDIQMTASLKQLETFLSSTIPKLEELKQQRFKKLQELQGRLIDLWDSLGVTILKQKPYSFMMRNCTATLDEVVEAKALSPEILQKVEFEVARLELLLKKSVADKTRYVCTQAEMIYNDGKAPKYEEPADVPHFTEKVCTWEQEHGKKFLYNGHRLKGRLQSEAEGRRNLTAGTSLAAGAAAAEASWDSWSGSSASDHSSKDPNFCPSDDSEEVESRA